MRFLNICKRFWALFLAVALLFAGGGVLVIRKDWCFAIERDLRHYPKPALTPIKLTEQDRMWTLEALEADARVERTDTLLLVNAANSLPQEYTPELELYNGAEMHPLMVPAYIALRDAVEAKTGERIYISDDYRSREEQEAILAEKGDSIAAAVGCSEHEAALALDVYVKGFGGMSFLKTAAGREINRNCSDYGFIIRYGNGKEDITGISYEPWHLRYVGMPHARIMAESNLSLEEYYSYLIPEQWYAFEEYRILVTAWDFATLPDGWESCELSSDNAGHTVITLKMA